MKYLLIIVCIFSLLACETYTPPIKHKFDKSRVYEKSFDEVWNKAIKWFSEHNTPIKTIDKSSGIISTEYNLRIGESDSLIDCGRFSMPLRDSLYWSGDDSGNFNIIIEKISDSKTKITISAFFQRILANKKYNCESCGYLEKQIMDYIEK